MSSEKLTIEEKNAIVQRFIEVCGSSEPARIQQLLKISYQAAKNYIHGRLPQTETLLKIAEHTPYSTHWLLTGKGNKFADEGRVDENPVLEGAMKASVREVCVEIFNEFLKENRTPEPKVVHLDANRLKTEKAIETPTALTEKAAEKTPKKN